MTIAVCNMQSKDTEVQVQFWRSLNAVMQRYGVPDPNFKEFMANNAMANWNAVRTVYGNGSDVFATLKYISVEVYTEAHQRIIPTTTYYFMQTIQRFQEYGAGRDMKPSYTVMVAIIRSCQ